MARKLAVESVVKYGLPIPAPKITTLPFSKCLTALRRINGSQTCCISIPDIKRVYNPTFSKALCKAIPLITVANIPM